LKAEEEARLKAEEEARIAAEAQAKAEEEAKLQVEAEAQIAAAVALVPVTGEDSSVVATDDAATSQSEPSMKPKLKGKSERAKKWKERLESKKKKEKTNEEPTQAMEAEKLEPDPGTTSDEAKDVIAETEVEKIPEKKVSDSERRKAMIEEEFNALIKQTEDNELEEEMEEEAKEALLRASNELAYLKKYYNSFTDKIVFFPSINSLAVSYDLIEKAEEYYYDEEDEFPLQYSAALRSVACENLEESNDDGDEEYMALLAADVEL
jgi:hypothetical protein